MDLRPKIDEIFDFVSNNIVNGVYKAGFGGSQSAYDEAFDALFSALDHVEGILANQRYLVGDQLTIADWRLFTSLLRFDPVYYVLFKCNQKRIADYKNLSRFAKELYAYPGVKETVNFDRIKRHYYRSLSNINPNGIVPKGPDMTFLEK